MGNWRARARLHSSKLRHGQPPLVALSLPSTALPDRKTTSTSYHVHSRTRPDRPYLCPTAGDAVPRRSRRPARPVARLCPRSEAHVREPAERDFGTRRQTSHKHFSPDRPQDSAQGALMRSRALDVVAFLCSVPAVTLEAEERCSSQMIRRDLAQPTAFFARKNIGLEV